MSDAGIPVAGKVHSLVVMSAIAVKDAFERRLKQESI